LKFHGQERPSAHDDPYVTNLVKNAENTLTVQKPEMFPASALDVDKQLLEALKPFAKLAAMFDHDVDDSWGIACESTGPIRIRDLRRARDALAATEKHEASALDVNKQLLEALKKAIGYCEEISTYGSKYGVLHGPIVSDARYIARALEEAIAAAEKGA
jgi:hypothetical protein